MEEWSGLRADPRPSFGEMCRAVVGAAGRKASDRWEVCSYADLSVLWRDGRLRLQCPACGPVAVPLHETTLSDLTNAAMEH